MSRYPCSGCGLWHCDGRCFLECAADYEVDPLEAEKIAEQVKRAEAFWERRQAEQFTETVGDPLLRRSASR